MSYSYTNKPFGCISLEKQSAVIGYLFYIVLYGVPFTTEVLASDRACPILLLWQTPIFQLYSRDAFIMASVVGD